MFRNVQTKNLCILIDFHTTHYNEINEKMNTVIRKCCNVSLERYPVIAYGSGIISSQLLYFCGVSFMKIAAFYENILEGAEKLGITDREALITLYIQGMRAIYISYDSLRSDKERLLSLFREIGLEVEGLHGFFDLGIDPESDGCMDMIRLAKEAGASNVLIVPGMISPEDENRREARLQNMQTALSKAVAYGEQEGIVVSMEDFDGLSAPYNSVEGLKWFLDHVPGLMCTFDTGNFIMFHEDEMEAFHLFRDRICALHIKDRSATPISDADRPKQCADGSFVYPAPVGSGYIKIREILASLVQDGYPGNVIAELYDYDDMLNGVIQSVSWLNATLQELGGA